MEGNIKSNFLAAYEYCAKCKSLDPDAVQDIAEEMWQKVLSYPERFEEFDRKRFTGYMYRCCWYRGAYLYKEAEKTNNLFVSIYQLLNDNGEYEEPIPQYYFDADEYERMNELCQPIICATGLLNRNEIRLLVCLLFGMTGEAAAEYMKMTRRNVVYIKKSMKAKLLTYFSENS